MILGTSARTTIVGYAGAVAYALIPILQGKDFAWNDLVIAGVIALLGRFAKDANQTGAGA